MDQDDLDLEESFGMDDLTGDDPEENSSGQSSGGGGGGGITSLNDMEQFNLPRVRTKDSRDFHCSVET